MDQFDRAADVVVIGAGVAGLAAAIAAAQMGLEPLLLEKHDKIGGSTCYSWGFLWSAPNHLADAAGEPDNEDDFRAYMEFLSGGEADPERLEAFIRGAPVTLKYFEDAGLKLKLARGLTDHYHGIAPGSRATGRCVETALISGAALGDWKDKIVVPPAEYRVTSEELVAWGGMNNVANWPAEILEARRATDERGLGVGLISQLLSVLLRLGFEPEVGCGVARLITDRGRVVGVETNDGTTIQARLGVVIATGGYESNPRLIKELEALPRFVSMFPPHITGDGLIMGQEVGAAIHYLRANMALFLGYEIPGEIPFFRSASIIEMCSPHTLVVNRAGQRFTDESYFQRVVPKILHFDPVTHSYPHLPCYLIFDRQYVERYSVVGDAPGAPVPDWIARGESLTELARELGLDGEELEKTVERFNGFVQKGIDDDFGRGTLAFSLAKESGRTGNSTLGTVKQGPFYAIELHPSLISSAGLAADAVGHVVHVRGHPIPGLYASGNAAARTEYGAGYQAGHSLMSGMTFSLLAVQDMLAQKPA